MAHINETLRGVAQGSGEHVKAGAIDAPISSPNHAAVQGRPIWRHATRKRLTAEAIGKGLGGRKTGAGWQARCPAHDDRQPSLSISDAPDGKVLVKCFAGCQQGRVIEALKNLDLWDEAGPRGGRLTGAALYRDVPAVKREPSDDDKRRTDIALSNWERSTPADSMLAAVYLKSRGITLKPPATLRYRSWLRHPGGAFWPCMVALVTDGKSNVPLGIHRTYLARDGIGKAPVEPQKLMLGPCRGGAVRLAPVAPLLMVGEGIETCLGAMQISGKPAWAALSTSGLRALELPAEVREVIILADGDQAGEAAAMKAGHRWKNEGLKVRIARAPAGQDWNDVLIARGAVRIGGAS